MFPVEHRNTLNRTSNRLADTKDPLLPIFNGDGAAPANFPATKNALVALTTAQLQSLLQFYQEDADGTLPVLRQRFQTFIGIK